MDETMIGHSSGPDTFTVGRDELIVLYQRIMTEEEFKGIKEQLPQIVDTHDKISKYLGDCLKHRVEIYIFINALKEQKGSEVT